MAIIDLREIARAIAAKAADVIPDFTDHSVDHMDALWGICDEVFTPAELKSFTTSEAFVLGAAFYVHDIGMCAGATQAGRAQLEASEQFSACFARLSSAGGMPEKDAREIALRVAARDRHASFAETCLENVLPGLDRYLIESKELRDRWAHMIELVAASHNWPLREVDDRLGNRGAIPSPEGDTIDLGFVACALRIIDYAHMNLGRAAPLDRLLRSKIGADSLLHWYAQERIAGPHREGDILVYGSLRPIKNVEAWWVFYEMASGLDREIAAVAEYLKSRTPSANRFSLEAVKGVRSPKAFAALVAPEGFEPVDVRFRPDSVGRLVGILGGQTLYGNDRFAPLRELLQNARDAIHLQRAVDRAEGNVETTGEIQVRLEQTAETTTLSVTDDGVGMSEKVVTSYLLGIASDYWRSADFTGEYPEAAADFHPVGKFGIGFLSVFMVGEDVEVRTQRSSGPLLQLHLRGVGRRGSLQMRPAAKRGTAVSVTVATDQVGNYKGLSRIIQAKAPMLDVEITVNERGTTNRLAPNWWRSVTQEELTAFIGERDIVATTPAKSFAERRDYFHLQRYGHLYRFSLSEIEPSLKWPNKQPEVITDTSRLIATTHRGAVLLCSKGFGITTVPIEGISGLVDLGEVELNAARSTPIDFDERTFRELSLQRLHPHIIAATNSLIDEGIIPARYGFLARIASTYGSKILREITLPWVCIIERPGNAVLISPAELLSRLAKVQDVLITYAVGPWRSEGSARERFPNVPRDALIIPVSTAGGPAIGSYKDESEIIEGKLPEHFVDEYPGSRSLVDTAHLLTTTLDLISESWGLSREAIFDKNWVRVKRELFGHLSRR